MGADFGKQNCAGVEWTTRRTRVLSLNSISVVEVEENELGLPVTASFHVKVPPCHNEVFQVNIHGDTTGMHIITANNQFLEKNPNVYQHEISIVSDDTIKTFPLVTVTNLDFAKTLHIGKGEIIGFARPESEEVVDIATSSDLDMEPYWDSSPHNWIPPHDRKPLEHQNDKKTGRHSDSSKKSSPEHETTSSIKDNPRLSDESKESMAGRHQATPLLMKVKAKELQGKEERSRLSDESTLSKHKLDDYSQQDRLLDELTESIRAGSHSSEQDGEDRSWNEINKVIESDFLISPGDIYPSRKVELKDAEVSPETLLKFDDLCEKHKDAFSKNNQDIGKTQLIEMEIDTGNSVPFAQSPYMLPLKHYDWVRKEIETLEKAGVIERSLSLWASPVIVVPKKSAPDEPPRRCLCVDYRRVNALQQEVKRTDKSTGCLTLYPLPKIDEMFAKLGGAKVFSTIDLRSAYYHIGLTRESQAKSDGKVAIQAYTLWFESSTSLLPAANRPSLDGLWRFCDGLLR